MVHNLWTKLFDYGIIIIFKVKNHSEKLTKK